MAATLVPLSGSAGTIKISTTVVAEVTKWKFAKKVDIHKYASNATSGYKAACHGAKDGSISIEGKYQTTLESQIDVGTAVTLLLYIDGTRYYSIPAIVSAFDIDVDIDGGDWESFTATAESNGAWDLSNLTA